MKKIFQNINLIIIIIVIAITTFLIGKPIDILNIFPVFILIGIYSIIYFLAKIFKREKLVLNKIDICVIILMVSSVIPLVFKTYASLSNLVYGIISNITILSFYLILRTETRKHPEYKKILICTIIISIVVLCIIGIDEMYGNYLEGFKEKIGYELPEGDENRLASLFSYSNTMAIMSVCGVFLCIGRIYNSKRKLPYIICIVIMLYSLVLTYSRLVYMFFVLMVGIAIFVVLKKFKIKLNKKIILGCGLFLLVAVIYVVVGLQIPDSLEVTDEYRRIIYQANSDADYVFTFDITSSSLFENSAVLKIIEKNKYFDDLKTTTYEIGGINGTEEFAIHTQNSTAVIYIEIQNKTGLNLTIENAKLNGEEFVLKYKILPTKIVEKCEGISLNNKSAWERLTFIEDAAELIKENWIFGYGAGSWQTLQTKVQDYYYFAHEVHSFILQIFLENGIVGFLAVLILIIFVIKNFIKNINNKNENSNITNIFYTIAILSIVLHSLLDFNMSFIYVQIVMLVILVVIDFEGKDYTLKFSSIAYVFILITSVINIYLCTVEITYESDESAHIIGMIFTGNEDFEKYYELIPYNFNLKVMEYYSAINSEDEIKPIVMDLMETEKYSSNCVNLSVAMAYCSTQEEVDVEFCEYLLEYIYETENFAQYIPRIQVNRFQIIANITAVLKEAEEIELAEKFNIQLEKEIAEKKECILDWEKCRYNQVAVIDWINELEKIEN